MDELGLQLNDQLSGLPQAMGGLATGAAKTPIAVGGGPAASSSGGGNVSPMSDADADLQARLDNLRRE